MNDYTVKNLAAPDMTSARFVSEIRAANSPVSDAESEAVYAYVASRQGSHAFILAMFKKESNHGTKGWAVKTRSFGNTRPPSYARPGIGAFNQDTGAFLPLPLPSPMPKGRYLSAYGSWADGGVATAARFLDNPAYAKAHTVSEIVPIWAPPIENDTPKYIADVLNEIARLGGTGMATPREVTDRSIASLRQRGCDVTDLRGKLPVNPNPANRYGLVRGGLGGVTKLIQHWTGDAFNRATIAQIVGTDYGGDTISPAMTRQDEIDLLTWYANYHIGRDGGTWGGIAYGTLVMPSGRVYVAWDIGTLTYHAFSVNGYSYALCTPASNGQAPTAAQLVALNQCWWVLCEETPEIPAGWADLWGHTEAKRFDAQNQTTCPGPVLLGHVQRARANAAPTVPLAATPVVTVLAQPQPAETERNVLLGWADAIPPEYRGELVREGVVDLAGYPGGKADERLAIYQRIVAHRLGGRNYVMPLDLWDQLRQQAKITLY